MNSDSLIYLSMTNRRKVTLCNHNYSEEGILHPDRIMDEYDLLYMQNGEWDIIEDNNTYHLTPGTCILLEPGKHHYSVEKCSPKMRNIYIHFSADTNDIPVMDKSQALESSSTLPVLKFTNISNNHELVHIMEKIIGAFWSKKDAHKDLRCSIYLEELLLFLSDEYNINRGNADILVSEIIHRFDCETDHFLSPEELARDYNISVRTLSNRFKKWTGMSIHQYQIKLKLDMAYNMLPISKGRSLHDIALSFGFYDEFQFSKLFKREFGISPSERR